MPSQQQPSSMFRSLTLLLLVCGLSLLAGISFAYYVLAQIMSWQFLWNRNAHDGTQPTLGCEHDNSCPYLAKGDHFAVASDHRTCSQIGLNVLRMEGNAVDAAVATSLCIGVMNSFSSGIGGGAIMMYRDEQGSVHTVDAREKAPQAADQDMFVDNIEEAQLGGKAIAVPGEILGLWTLWQQHGSVPWKYLVEPSVELARVHRVEALLADTLQQKKDVILEHPHLDEFRKVYAPEGTVLKEGDFVRNPRLADTLQLIADEGAPTFYNGTLAKRIAQDIQDVGGIIDEEDLNQYSVKESEPYCSTFFGYELCTARPEISGGLCNIMALNILERLMMRIPFKEDSSSEENRKLFHHYTIEAMKWVFSHRMHLADPDFVDIDHIVDNMLSKDYAGRVAEHVKDDATLDNWKKYAPLDSNEIYASVPNQGTSHFSVVDGQHRSVALTSTINLYFGSMILGKRTGIIFNDEMDDFSTPGEYNAFDLPPSEANFIKPGKRPLSSMSPMIISKNGALHMSVGASGGPIIPTSSLQAILNVIIFEQTLDQAIARPRFHHQLLPPVLGVEKQWPQEDIDYFKSLGHDVRVLDTDNHESLAVVQGVLVNDEGGVDAVSDWRKPAGFAYAS